MDRSKHTIDCSYVLQTETHSHSVRQYNNNNNRIFIAPYGRNFRRAGRQVGSVFSKRLIEQKRFKSRFKNRQRITDENCLWQRKKN